MAHKRRTKTTRLTARQTSISAEAEYIAGHATRLQTRIVTLGQLLFFATEPGDAWVLDPEDRLARCLAREGERLPTGITETAERFAIEWNFTYEIEGDSMVFTEGPGRTRVVFGYPVAEIQRAIGRMRLQGQRSSR